jgi:hypothetical protein
MVADGESAVKKEAILQWMPVLAKEPYGPDRNRRKNQNDRSLAAAQRQDGSSK